MRELILLRHAKSSWDDPSLDDFDRPLSDRGREAAPLMGHAMAERDWMPDAVLVSAALRTRQTWRLAAAELGEGVPRAAYDDALYMASAERLLTLIRTVSGDPQRLLVVAHNPGLEDLAIRLANIASEREALKRLGQKFPTAALARFVVPCPWPELGFEGAKLADFLRPKDVANA